MRVLIVWWFRFCQFRFTSRFDSGHSRLSRWLLSSSKFFQKAAFFPRAVPWSIFLCCSYDARKISEETYANNIPFLICSPGFFIPGGGGGGAGGGGGGGGGAEGGGGVDEEDVDGDWAIRPPLPRTWVRLYILKENQVSVLESDWLEASFDLDAEWGRERPLLELIL